MTTTWKMHCSEFWLRRPSQMLSSVCLFWGVSDLFFNAIKWSSLLPLCRSLEQKNAEKKMRLRQEVWKRKQQYNEEVHKSSQIQEWQVDSIWGDWGASFPWVCGIFVLRFRRRVNASAVRWRINYWSKREWWWSNSLTGLGRRLGPERNQPSNWPINAYNINITLVPTRKCGWRGGVALLFESKCTAWEALKRTNKRLAWLLALDHFVSDMGIMSLYFHYYGLITNYS